MKLGVLSDIHVDLNYQENHEVEKSLIKIIKKQNIDVMLIAGDITNNYKKTVDIIEIIQEESGARCLFVPGNHDVWNAQCLQMNTWDIYESLLVHPGNIAQGPVKLSNEWVVLGDIGWYDFSFGAPEIGIAEFERMEVEGRTWQDKIYTSWGAEKTLAVHKYFYNKLKATLEENKGKNIIYMSHVVPHDDFIVPQPNKMWRYLNAFLGSREYGELIINYNVRYAIFGHVHYRKQKHIGQTTFLCNCLGYINEWKHSDDPDDEIAKAIVSIEIK